MIRNLFYMIVVLLVVTHQVAAQDACELALTKAQEEFDAGRFHSVPGLLEECLRKNQNREFEQRAYLLLAETYLLLENPVMADESYLKVLQSNPEFVTDETRDPIDLVYLSKKFTATPVFSFSGRLGVNATLVSIIHDVRIDGNEKATEEYAMKGGFQGGVGLEYHYDDRWSAAGELNYVFTSFAFQSKNQFTEHTTELIDRQTWLMIPLTVRYSKPLGSFRPYGYLGYSFNLLLSTKSNLVVDGDNESPEFDFKENRNTFTQSFILGGGLKYKWGLRYFFADARYSMGLKNFARPENRNFPINPIDTKYPYVDDDFRINNIFFSVGYIHPFYKARKLKRAKTRSVLRKMKGGSDEAK